MSLVRQFLREFRPVFRMLEEPIARHPSSVLLPSRSIFDDPFFHSLNVARPAVDVTDHGNSYTVEAELPGVKKEDIEVKIGEGGRSITVEGKVVDRRNARVTAMETPERSVENKENGTPASEEADSAALTTPGDTSNEITTEGAFKGSTTFTRTVWLPRPVNAAGVAAKLSDGILTITVPKAIDSSSVQIPVQ